MLKSFLEKRRPEIYAILRFMTGFLFFWHGMRKLFAYPSAGPDAPMWVDAVGGPLQLIGGICIMIGFGTRLSAFLCSGMMAIGYWVAYGHKAFLPIVNGGELAALYCFTFLYLAARGDGDYSIADYLTRRRSDP